MRAPIVRRQMYAGEAACVQRKLQTFSLVFNGKSYGFAQLANRLSGEWACDSHQEDICGGEGTNTRLDCSAKPGDHHGKFSARNQGESCPEACAPVAGLRSSCPVAGKYFGCGGDESQTSCREKDRRKGPGIDFQSKEEKESGGEKIAQGCQKSVSLFTDRARDSNANKEGSNGS